jgi:UrcA family protein
MTKVRIALLGAVMSAALAAGIGAGHAQDYYGVSDGGAYQREYDRAMGRDLPAPGVESVIVHPYYDRIEKRQVLGRQDGSINPTAYSLSRPVDFSDLNLSNPADRAELRIRIHETALDVCSELDARVPALRGDRDADRRCVREAARQAMRDVYGYG